MLLFDMGQTDENRGRINSRTALGGLILLKIKLR
jgi:hypothetical protein